MSVAELLPMARQMTLNDRLELIRVIQDELTPHELFLQQVSKLKEIRIETPEFEAGAAEALQKLLLDENKS